MNRFRLERSSELPDWWVLTDTENLVVIRFKEHAYNESQKITVLDDSELIKDPDCANRLAHILSEMGQYMFEHAYSVAMPVPVFEIRKDESSDKLLLIRHKYPKFALEIQDDCEAKQLADALKSAGEFIKKRSGYGRKGKQERR